MNMQTALITVRRGPLKDAAWRQAQVEVAMVCNTWGNLDISPVANGHQSHVAWDGKVEDVSLYLVDYESKDGEDFRFELVGLSRKLGLDDIVFLKIPAEGVYKL